MPLRGYRVAPADVLAGYDREIRSSSPLSANTAWAKTLLTGWSNLVGFRPLSTILRRLCVGRSGGWRRPTGDWLGLGGLGGCSDSGDGFYRVGGAVDGGTGYEDVGTCLGGDDGGAFVDAAVYL